MMACSVLVYRRACVTPRREIVRLEGTRAQRGESATELMQLVRMRSRKIDPFIWIRGQEPEH